ncbi:hypothetical protein ACLOJK_031050 [Asimina triloba]
MEDGDGNFLGGDRAEQFHRNEAISAVADDGFSGEEEEEDDYEDLYNDVNVGDGFLQTLKPEDEIEDSKKTIEPPEPPPVSMPGVGGSGSSSRGVDGRAVKREAPEGDSKPPQESIFRGTEAGARVPAMKVEMGGESSSSKVSEMQGQFGKSTPQHVVGGNSFASASASSTNANVNGGGGGGGPAVGAGPASSGGVGVVPSASGAGGTVLYVGELHWWTTDAELESELSKYGAVKELKFYDEKAGGKSKGYCQVEFYDPAAAAACKEGMNGHVFNGRPCVVAFASPMTVCRKGEAMMNKNRAMAASQQGPGQGRRGQSDGGRGSGVVPGASFQNFGRGGWPRGGGAMGNRGPIGIGSMRNRVGMGGRGIIGNSGNGFGQGLPAAAPPLLQPQAMMGQGFDPTYGTAMGRMCGGYGGFPGATVPPFSGLLSSFPGVGGVGLPGVAPHVNPAFFGRGMPANGTGMPAPGAENAGMWSDPSVSGWAGEEQGGRAGVSSYGEDALSEQQFGEAGHDRGWSNAAREKDRASERDAPDRRYHDDREPGWDREGTRERDTGRHQDWSERRHRGDREAGWDCEQDRERERDPDRDRDRDHYREDRERYSGHHRYRDRDMEHDDEWDRAQSSRSHHSKSRLSHEEGQRHRLRDVEHGKRRRLSLE